jgi:RNA polymerase-binding protein DksA
VRGERDRAARARSAAAADLDVLPPPPTPPDLDIRPGDRTDRLGPAADVELEERRTLPPPPRWSKAEEERYRGKLLDAREAIRKNLEELREELRGLQVPSHELEEWAQEEKERDILILQEQRQEEELSRIQIALARLEGGTYGQCARCGRRISKERLDEIPTAVFCRNCQP